MQEIAVELVFGFEFCLNIYHIAMVIHELKLYLFMLPFGGLIVSKTNLRCNISRVYSRLS